MNPNKVGKTILFLRKHYNMTQHELAEKLGVTDKAVSRWENGYGTPDISLLSKLSIILDIDIESILEGNLTHWEMMWEGLLLLHYSEDISPMDMIYGTRIVEFQLSMFLLAGINSITVVGSDKKIKDVSDYLGDGKQYGCIISYQIWDDESVETRDSIISRKNADTNVMVISQLSFLYGKDITKYFKRIMNNDVGSGMLMNYLQKNSGISFFNKGAFGGWTNLENICLERGVISFAIDSRNALMDASTIVMLLEKYNDEKVANLTEIALRRGLISGDNISL